MTFLPTKPTAASRTWVTSPPPDQVMVMSSTPLPTGLPKSAFGMLPKSGSRKPLKLHVAAPLPGDTLTLCEGISTVQKRPFGVIPGLKSWIWVWNVGSTDPS